MKKCIVLLIILIIPFTLIRVLQLHSENDPSQAEIQKMSIACKNDDVETVKLLLDKGYGINFKNHKGNTPLHWAAGRGSINAGKLLIDSGAEVNIKNEIDYTPLHEAANNGRTEFVKLLIEKGADVNAKGGLKVTGEIIGNGAKLNNTPLHIALDYSGYKYEKILSTIKILLSSGADVNAKNFDNRTPLYYAAGHPYEKFLKEILKYKPDLNIKNKYNGNTAIHNAIGARYYKNIILLISNGADLNIKNKNGKTPLQCAINPGRRQKILKILEKAETPALQQLIKEGKKEEVIAILSEIK